MIEPKTLPNKGPSKVNRSISNINMQWLSERVRRSAKIKKQVLANQYYIDSKLVVSAMLNLEIKAKKIKN